MRTVGFARGAGPEGHPLTMPMAGMCLAGVVVTLGVKLDFTQYSE